MRIIIKSLLVLSLVSILSPKYGFTLEGPCEEELQTYCSNIQPGQGRVMACLKRYESSLSAECKDFIEKSSALKNLGDACANDAHDFCRDVKTSYRRIVHCLKEHINDISTDCRNLLK